MHAILLQTIENFSYPVAPFSIGFSFVGLLYIIALWVILRKAGRGGWEIIIPIYGAYVLLKIVGKSGWWLLLYCIPVVNIVFIVWTYNMLSKSFGKSEGFTVGLIFLGIIFFPILAFGDAVYQGPYGDKAAFDAYRNEHTFDFEKQ